MYDLVDEPVDVLVAFRNNRAMPWLMKWNGKKYDIKQVNLIHSVREGSKKIFYFSVSDPLNYFKLKFDTETLEWRLVEIYTDG
ncbi:MAG: hypothetical protein PHW53_02910 [Patescibacteria group bacterium]|nr:hypothetical protein [Patescibacteria group bacterium]